MVLCMMISSCSKPKIIPDDELAEIFRDAFVVNAYTQIEHIANLDSLNIYEPIFAEYGYTSEDVQFTIGNFAKRKSARLSGIVDNAIDMLAAQNNFYKRRVAIVDSISLIARERYAAVVYTDTLISARQISDTSKLKIVIPIDRPGTYEVSYRYFIDTIDHNHNIRASHYLLDNRNRQSSTNTRRMKRFERDRFTSTFTADGNHRKLVIDLNGYAEKDKITRPHLTVDTLVVKRFLPNRVALDSMGKSWIDHSGTDTIAYRRWGFPRPDSVVYIIRPYETDIVALPADSTGASAR